MPPPVPVQQLELLSWGDPPIRPVARIIWLRRIWTKLGAARNRLIEFHALMWLCYECNAIGQDSEDILWCFIACNDFCLAAPRRYLNRCWFINKCILWYSRESNFIQEVPMTLIRNFRAIKTSHRARWIKRKYQIICSWPRRPLWRWELWGFIVSFTLYFTVFS